MTKQIPLFFTCLILLWHSAVEAQIDSSQIKKVRQRYDSAGPGAAALVAYDRCKRSQLTGPLCVQAAVYFVLDGQTEVVNDLLADMSLGDWNGYAFARHRPYKELNFEKELLLELLERGQESGDTILRVAYLAGVENLWLENLRVAARNGQRVESELWERLVDACRSKAVDSQVATFFRQLVGDQMLRVDLSRMVEFSRDAAVQFGECQSELQNHVLYLPPAGYEPDTLPVRVTLQNGIDVEVPLTVSPEGELQPAVQWREMKRSSSGVGSFYYTFDYSAVSSSMPQRCQQDELHASRIFKKAAPESLLVVHMPHWKGQLRANYHGCVLEGAAGEIAVPYEGWPQNKVEIRFAENVVTFRNPGKPTTKTLNPADYRWMYGILKISRVPADFQVQERGQRIECTESENIGSCLLPAGAHKLTIQSSGRNAVDVEASVSPGQQVPVEVRLGRSGMFSFGIADIIAASTVVVGGALVGAGMLAISSERQQLQDLPGSIPAGRLEQVKLTELFANLLANSGIVLVALGSGAEVWFLIDDALTASQLPEWK